MLPTPFVSGIFVLDAPFDKLLQPDIKYTCVAIRYFVELVDAGIEPFEEYYEPNQLDKAVYDKDATDNTPIVTLRSTQNSRIDVPASFIKAVPNNNGVSYHSMLLSVDIGSVPTDIALDSLMDTISQVTRDYLGILDPEVQPVAVSDATIISMEDHDRLEQARKNRITERESDRSKAIRLETIVDAQRIKIQQLEEYIKTKIPPG